ncbi:MMPL family transporter, partial [Sulfolobus sp. B1]
MKKGALLLILWLILLSITLPLAIKTPSLLIYSDSPFLSNSLQSVKAQNILMKYFNIGDKDYLYVIINGTYNYSIDEIYRYIYLLNDSIIITPFNYSKILENEYISYLGANESILKNDNLLTTLYQNLTKLKLFYITHFQYFEYELNVTFWLPLHNFSNNICPEYKINFDKVNGSLLERARYAGYLTFRNPFLFYFGFNNYTNYTLA